MEKTSRIIFPLYFVCKENSKEKALPDSMMIQQGNQLLFSFLTGQGMILSLAWILMLSTSPAHRFSSNPVMSLNIVLY